MLVLLPDPFRGTGHRRIPRRPNSRATPQGLNQRSKMEESSAKHGAPERLMRGNPEGKKLDPAVEDCRRCKSNSLA